jgi:hypothetical protein
MRYGSGLGQNGTAVQVETQSRLPTGVGTAAKDIPYDYVATFKLTGRKGNRVHDVISVSSEGEFIAVAIGYSFLPSSLPVEELTSLGGEALEVITDIPEALLFALTSTNVKLEQLAKSIVQARLVSVCGIDFKYSVVDSGTGRELQNQAIHNIAGLGSPNGERPFRPFARPALFAPRTTIRFEIEEVSEGPLFENGILFIALHGYKRLLP